MACELKQRLVKDYMERTQALAVEAELLLGALEANREEDWAHRWFRLEHARIDCEIARLALGTHAAMHRC